MNPMKPVAVALAASLLSLGLAGCAVTHSQAPAPTVSAPKMIAPVMKDIFSTEDLTLVAGGMSTVFFDQSGDDPTLWSATFSQDGIAEFVPASNDGSASFNPSLNGLAVGDTTMTLTNSGTGKTVVVVVHVVESNGLPNGEGGVIGGNSGGDSTGDPTVGSVTPGGTSMEEQVAATKKFAQTLIGLTVQAADKAAVSNGYVIREVSIDGVGQIVTADYRTNRIDVTVVHDIVTEVTVG
jgi:hypothetical protein